MTPSGFDETRPHLKDFTSFYDSEIAGWLSEQEGRRREAVRRMWLILLSATPPCVGLVMFGLGFFTARPPEGWEDFFIFGGSALAVGAFALALKDVRAVKADVKGFLLPKICAFMELSYSASPEGFPLDDFRGLSLVPRWDRRTIEDAISGSREDAQFNLVEAHLEQKRRSKNRTYYVAVFRGILMLCDFPKRFSGTTVVTQDAGLLGNWLKGFSFEGEHVRLEDPRFEKVFEVFSDDQVEARYLLSPTFMERVIDLSTLMGNSPVQLAFSQSRLMISVKTGENWFEGGSMFRPLADKSRIVTILDQISAVHGIIGALNVGLKTRI